MSYRVLIPQDVAEEGKRFLRERGHEIVMGSGATAQTVANEARDCDAILVRTALVTRDVFAAAPKLKVVAKHGVGVDNIDVTAATDNGVFVTYTPTANSNTVAEHTIGLMLALARNFVRCDQALRAGNFNIRNELLGTDLEGKTLGLIGLGRIGARVAKKAAHGLDMKVIAFDPHVGAEQTPSWVERTADWETVWTSADFVSLHLPATPQTQKIVGAREFALMKPSAFVINASRGEVLDEAALFEALQQNKIAGAGLDVFDQEPPPDDHPLFGLANVVVTPHNAALTREATIRMALHAAQGIDEVLGGKPPTWPVNTLA